MDLMKLALDAAKNQTFNINCPKCGEKIAICFNDDEKEIICTGCKASIKIDAKI